MRLLQRRANAGARPSPGAIHPLPRRSVRHAAPQPRRLLAGDLAAAAARSRRRRARRAGPPTVPGEIAPPAGHKPFLVGHAAGVQTYTCLDGRRRLRLGARRPHRASSATTTARSSSATSPVRAGRPRTAAPSIGPPRGRRDRRPHRAPLAAALRGSATPGADGDRLAGTTYIQRVATTGGLPPAADQCTRRARGRRRRALHRRLRLLEGAGGVTRGADAHARPARDRCGVRRAARPRPRRLRRRGADRRARRRQLPRPPAPAGPAGAGAAPRAAAARSRSSCTAKPGCSPTASRPTCCSTSRTPVAPAEARSASRRFPGAARHPFPDCLACGPAHPRGLRVFPGPVSGRSVVAALWVPPAALAGADGRTAERARRRGARLPSALGADGARPAGEHGPGGHGGARDAPGAARRGGRAARRHGLADRPRRAPMARRRRDPGARRGGMRRRAPDRGRGRGWGVPLGRDRGRTGLRRRSGAAYADGTMDGDAAVAIVVADGEPLAFPSIGAALARAAALQPGRRVGVDSAPEAEARAVAAGLSDAPSRARSSSRTGPDGAPATAGRSATPARSRPGATPARPVWELLWGEPAPRSRIRLCGEPLLEIDGERRTHGGGQAAALLALPAREPAARGGPRRADRRAVAAQRAARPAGGAAAAPLAPPSRDRAGRAGGTRPAPARAPGAGLDRRRRGDGGARGRARRGEGGALGGGAPARGGGARAAAGRVPPGPRRGVGARAAGSRSRSSSSRRSSGSRAARSASAGRTSRSRSRRAGELIARSQFRETGYRFLMEALAGGGNVAEALRVYDELRVLLRDELGTAPAGEVQALHQRLLGGEDAGREIAVEPAAAFALPRQLAPRERSAFVARERELDVLREAWRETRAAAAGGSSSWPGSRASGRRGSTTEFAAEAHRDGTVLYAACQEDALVAYQPFVEALRGAGARLDAGRAAAGGGRAGADDPGDPGAARGAGGRRGAAALPAVRGDLLGPGPDRRRCAAGARARRPALGRPGHAAPPAPPHARVPRGAACSSSARSARRRRARRTRWRRCSPTCGATARVERDRRSTASGSATSAR